jgi:uncharacterized RDD family membrane protein YckC
LPKLEIMTPEQVVFRCEVAGLVARALAWLLDSAIILAGYAAILLAFSAFGGALGVFFIILGIFFLDFSYFVLFEIYRAGQTPGKRALGLRVMSVQGTRLRFGEAVIRNLLRPVDMLPWVMVLGGTVAFFDRWHRRLGDLAAETVVVRYARQALPQALAAEKSRANSFRDNRGLRQRILTRITREERDLILDLAVRRDQLEAATRESLFGAAARHFRDRFGLGEDLEHLSEEQTVINLALLVQDAKFAG